MKKLFLLFSILCFQHFVFSQFPENNYATSSNKYYWKNRIPIEGYWQQDIHYTIKATLDDKTDIISGNLTLVYTNNSPDDLNYVYFHLYNNAQTKNSYLSDLYHNNNYKLEYGKYQEQGLGTEVLKITSENQALKSELDNTILKVYLNKPLKSGEKINFEIDFKTYFDTGSIRNRMKMFNSFGYKHYDVVHWYPRIAVYDKKFGWNTDQHLDHEFYGNFGTFDVSFSIPNNYILDATGELINEKEVMPADLRAKLDIKNFKNKPWNEKPSVIIEPNGTNKTWLFHAINVHDFALTADPTYRIGEAECMIAGKDGNNIKCIALVQEPHAAHWQNAAEYAAKIIRVNSYSIGMYAYPKMIVADARDGMEYPMLTLCGGYDPDYRDLFAHEISHNWFMGMVGTNETYRAAMDEGFTQFLTCWAYERIDGMLRVKYLSKSKYVNRFSEPDFIRNSEVYNGYMRDAVRGEETNINIHSDMFHGAVRHGGGYGQVYYKTATMLYNLQYVLGDSLFLGAMQHYFNQWKFAHPYMEDFRNSIIQYTKVDLNWFFDQWMETSKTVDYGIKKVKPGKKDNEYKITFKRYGMQMPLDFTVVATNDSLYDFHIPNNWFVKETKATVLPRWIGWDNVKKTYTATVVIPEGIDDIYIDPSRRLADINMLNNQKRFPVKYRFDSKIYNTADWTTYELYTRPDIWYNGYDGVKLGLHMNGHYMNFKHIFSGTVWFNTGMGQNMLDTSTTKYAKDLYDEVSYSISYKTATEKLLKGSSLHLQAKSLDGLQAYLVGYDKKNTSGSNRVFMYFKSMYRKRLTDLPYLILPNEWQVNKINTTLNIGLEHFYNYHLGNGKINLSMRSSTLMSDYDYHSLNLNVVNNTNLWRLVLKTRLVGQYGTGSNWADESSLFLAGANPEEMMDNKYTRSLGFFDPKGSEIGASTNYNHFGGGLNLRGYSGYLAPHLQPDGIITNTYKGQTGAAINAELEFDGIVKINKQNWLTKTFKLNTYLFADAGIINYSKPSDKALKMADIRVDAGIGTALTIKKFGVLQTVEPLTIRFDMPLFLNRTPASFPDYVQFRFVVGISRAF